MSIICRVGPGQVINLSPYQMVLLWHEALHCAVSLRSVQPVHGIWFASTTCFVDCGGRTIQYYRTPSIITLPLLIWFHTAQYNTKWSKSVIAQRILKLSPPEAIIHYSCYTIISHPAPLQWKNLPTLISKNLIYHMKWKIRIKKISNPSNQEINSLTSKLSTLWWRKMSFYAGSLTRHQTFF